MINFTFYTHSIPWIYYIVVACNVEHLPSPQPLLIKYSSCNIHVLTCQLQTAPITLVQME